MDESRGIGICHMAFILLYIGVVITAIDGRNILDISYAIFENWKGFLSEMFPVYKFLSAKAMNEI